MKNLITLVFIVLAVIFFVRAVETFWQPVRNWEPSGGPVSQSPANPIDMVEPNGFPKRDEQYSNTNQNNALAEVYRAQAEVLYAKARDLDAQAQLYPALAEMYRAEAYRIRKEADATMLLAEGEFSKTPAGGVSIFKDGMGTGQDIGANLAYRNMVIAVLLLIVGLLVASKK